MGKQMSKVGAGRRSTHRRQRSSHEPTVIPSPAGNTALPHQFASESTDRAILTLKLQRDELTVYKGNAQALSRKEEEIVRRLVKAGRNDRAKALLKKKRFQEQLISETEKQLNSVLNEAGAQVPDRMRKEVEQKIELNQEAIKKLHLLVSLENLEKLMEEGDGSKKLGEVDKLLALASSKEQEELEEGADKELQRLVGGGGSPKVVDTIQEQEEEAGAKVAETRDNDIEMLVMQKLKEVKKEEAVVIVEVDAEKTPTAEHQDLVHKGDVVVDTSEDEYVAAPGEQVPSTDLIQFDDAGGIGTAEGGGAIEVVISNTQSVVSSLSELNAGEDADDEKSLEGGPSESQITMPLPLKDAPAQNLSSSLLPDVPTHSIEVAGGEDGIVAETEAENQGVAGDIVQAGGPDALLADEQYHII